MKAIRIFISSPGDVDEERQASRAVIQSLRKVFAGQAELDDVLWEDLGLDASLNFQQGIDKVLAEKKIDIAVFILWSRLGSEVAGIRRKDNQSYRSGTERELDVLLEAHRQSKDDPKRPAILVYLRNDHEGFTNSLDSKKRDVDILDSIHQKLNAREFIKEYFEDEKGRNTRAYHSFAKPIDFTALFNLHLRFQIENFLGMEATTIGWKGNPYVSLKSFQKKEHAIFFGREEETIELATFLGRREREDQCCFVCVVGASGSGKSSLVRAGLAPHLETFSNILEDYSDDPNDSDKRSSSPRWSFLAITPSELLPQPELRLVEILASAFPRLLLEITPFELAKVLKENPQTFLTLSLLPAIRKSRGGEDRPHKLLLLVDQFEEFFTTDAYSEPSSEPAWFVAFLTALASSGSVSVVATLRSDFYPAAQDLDGFIELRGPRNFDLLPPGRSAIQRIITRPAALAGLHFEVLEENSSRTLADKIFDDVGEDLNALPLLQYALGELYRLREGHTLTRQAYDGGDGQGGFGGLRGVIQNRAEHYLTEYSKEHTAKQVEATFAHLFSKLFAIESKEGHEIPVRTQASEKDLLAKAPHPELSASLLHAFTEARLLVSTTLSDGDGTVYTVAHEALLTHWPRLKTFRIKQSENLQRRQRLASLHSNYLAHPEPSLLIPPGHAQNEAQELLENSPFILIPEQIHYIQESVKFNEKKRKQKNVIRNSTLAGLSILTAVSILFGYLARKSQHESLRNQEKLSEELENNERELEYSYFREGEFWLERAKLHTEKSRTMPGILSAAKSIGFRGYGITTSSEQKHSSVPPLLAEPFTAIKENENARIRSKDEAISILTTTSSLMMPNWINPNSATGKLCISPTGTQFANIDFKGNLVLTSTATGKQDRIIANIGPEGIKATAMSFSQDGEKLALRLQNGKIKVVELRLNKIQPFAHTSDGAAEIQFSPDAKTLLSQDISGITIFTLNGNTYSFLTKIPGSFRNTIFSPDGRYFACSIFNMNHHDEVAVFNTDKFTVEDQFKLPNQAGTTFQNSNDVVVIHQGSEIIEMGFNFNSQTLDILTSFGSLYTRNVVSKVLLNHKNLSEHGIGIIDSAQFSPSLLRLLVKTSEEVILYRPYENRIESRVSGLPLDQNRVYLSQTENFLITCSEAIIARWEVGALGEISRVTQQGLSPIAVAYHEDSKILASLFDGGQLCLADAKTGLVLDRTSANTDNISQTYGVSLKFSKNGGSLLLSYSPGVYQKKEFSLYKTTPLAMMIEGQTSCWPTFDKSGSLFAYTQGKILQIADTNTGKILHSFQDLEEDSFQEINFSGDSNFIWAKGLNGILHVWSLSRKKFSIKEELPRYYTHELSTKRSNEGDILECACFPYDSNSKKPLLIRWSLSNGDLLSKKILPELTSIKIKEEKRLKEPKSFRISGHDVILSSKVGNFNLYEFFGKKAFIEKGSTFEWNKDLPKKKLMDLAVVDYRKSSPSHDNSKPITSNFSDLYKEGFSSWRSNLQFLRNNSIQSNDTEQLTLTIRVLLCHALQASISGDFKSAQNILREIAPFMERKHLRDTKIKNVLGRLVWYMANNDISYEENIFKQYCEIITRCDDKIWKETWILAVDNATSSTALSPQILQRLARLRAAAASLPSN